MQDLRERRLHALSHTGGENDNVHRISMKRIQNFIMRPYRSFATACVLLITVSLMFGCSAARLAYSNGETLTYWWLDRYVEFDHNQSLTVKSDLANFFAWHRRTQLQGYVQFLKRAQNRVQGGITEAELQSDYRDIKKHVLFLTDRALPALADLALTLRPEQIDNIEKKFASNNDDYRKDYLRGSLEKRQHYRYKKVLQQAEHWFGNFNAEQGRQIRAVSDSRPLNNEFVLADRIQRQAAFVSMLRKIQSERPSKEATMAIIKNHVIALLDRSVSLSPEHKEFFDVFRASSIHLTAVIINGATPAQKAHFVKTTRRWIDDFDALAH